LKDHIVREHHLRETCVYCGRDLKEKHWEPMHCSERLYNMLKCECGKKAVIRLPFLGSGHDSWNHSTIHEAPTDRRTKLRNLESKIRVLSKV
jgi:hypothetical protein